MYSWPGQYCSAENGALQAPNSREIHTRRSTFLFIVTGRNGLHERSHVTPPPCGRPLGSSVIRCYVMTEMANRFCGVWYSREASLGPLICIWDAFNACVSCISGSSPFLILRFPFYSATESAVECHPCFSSVKGLSCSSLFLYQTCPDSYSRKEGTADVGLVIDHSLPRRR